MRILFTGGRAPATLELVRNFGAGGQEVFVADSMGGTLSQASNYVKAFFLTSPPRFREADFVKELIRIINENRIDVLFPTCEEIFWIAKNKREIQENCQVQVLCDRLETLALLHHKYRLIEFVKSLGISAPQTCLFDGATKTSKKCVIKPIYSRFGGQVMILEKNARIDTTGLSARQLVMQEFVEGESICSFGFAEHGMLKFHVCYRSPFPARTFTVFEPFLCAAVDEAVQTIVNKLAFTGNIAFDFIRQGESYFLIECNPRMTSGIHTLRKNAFEKLYFGQAGQVELECAQLRLPTVANGFKVLPYKDAVWDPQDKKPFFKQVQCLALFHAIARKQKISLTRAMTFDIEWNGER